MSAGHAEFQRLVGLLIARFYTQNSRPLLPETTVARFAAQLAQLIAQRGLPRALSAEECGAPGGMPEQECAVLVAQVMAELEDPLLAEVARQLVKACFYPEFKVCRDSFREVGRDGACRRQQVERVRGRISGTHCVDCPHWVALAPAAHWDYLRNEWRGDAATLEQSRAIFLPEDFRALRLWLHRAARRGVLSD
jgi:hypothetical protein